MWARMSGCLKSKFRPTFRGVAWHPRNAGAGLICKAGAFVAATGRTSLVR